MKVVANELYFNVRLCHDSTTIRAVAMETRLSLMPRADIRANMTVESRSKPSQNISFSEQHFQSHFLISKINKQRHVWNGRDVLVSFVDLFNSADHVVHMKV